VESLKGKTLILRTEEVSEGSELGFDAVRLLILYTAVELSDFIWIVEQPFSLRR
jgi:hypothetical protein